MITRNQALAFLGILLSVVGGAVASTLWIASFSHYARLEDLGLDVDQSLDPEVLRQLTVFTLQERTMFYGALVMIPVGLALLIYGLVKSSKTQSEGK